MCWRSPASEFVQLPGDLVGRGARAAGRGGAPSRCPKPQASLTDVQRRIAEERVLTLGDER